MTQAEAATTAVAKPYEFKPHEKATLEAYIAKQAEKPPRPEVRVKEKGGRVSITPDHPEVPLGHIMLARAMGSADSAFHHELLLQVANASGKGPKPDEGALNFMLAVIDGIGPRDQTEAILAAQMAAVHMATMTFAQRLQHVETIQQQDSAERAFNKLARTFAVQMETLKRYRTGGEQRVTVQHVTVNEGGQAIVGAVSLAPRGEGIRKTWRRPHEQQPADAPQSAVFCYVEADQAALPGARGDRVDRVPVPRRGRGWTEGRTQWRV